VSCFSVPLMTSANELLLGACVAVFFRAI